MVIKQITLFGLNATAADVFTIGATLGLNVLQEYFGKKVTRQAIVINFFLLILYTIMTQIHLAYIPSPSDYSQPYFYGIFSPAPRIIIASLTVYLLVQMLDYYLYAFFKQIAGGHYLLLRNYASIIICQLADTILFSLLGLWGIVDNIGQIIIVSYSIKIAAIVIATPFISLTQYIPNLSTTEKK